MSGALFSVLIANYNNAKYISSAIESVMRQTYSKWEIIVIDDASTDDSILQLEKYASDKRIKLHVNKRNKGVGCTKRRCVELAAGDICGFLDPDDVLSDDALAVMVDKHTENSSCSLIYSRHYTCDHLLSILRVSTTQRQLAPGESFLEVNGGAIFHFATFKKRHYDATPGIDAAMLRAIDIDLYYKLEEVGSTLFVDIPLYYYRIHEGGISTGNKALLAKSWHIYAIMSACRRRGIPFEELLAQFLSDTINYARDECFATKEYRLGKVLLSPLRKLKTTMKQ